MKIINAVRMSTAGEGWTETILDFYKAKMQTNPSHSAKNKTHQTVCLIFTLGEFEGVAAAKLGDCPVALLLTMTSYRTKNLLKRPCLGKQGRFSLFIL